MSNFPNIPFKEDVLRNKVKVKGYISYGRPSIVKNVEKSNCHSTNLVF